MLPPVGIEPGPLIASDSKSNTNLTFACKTESLGSLYSHALLILLKSSKSKHQVVHEQKFKDLLSSTCQVSVERIVSDLESEEPGFYSHWGLHFVTGFFSHSKASDANIAIIVNFVYLRKTRLDYTLSRNDMNGFV